MSIPELIIGKGNGIPSWTIILFLEGMWDLPHQDIQLLGVGCAVVVTWKKDQESKKRKDIMKAKLVSVIS